MEILTRWKDPTIDDLIKENLELKRKLGEADEAVEYWQIECDKRSKVLDKIKEYIKENACYDKNIKQCCRDLLTDECDYVLELLEEIE